MQRSPFLRIAVCGSLTGLFSLASAQALKLPPPKPDTTAGDKTQTLSLAAKLVNLPVVVRDKKGALVQNLTKEDFTLSVDSNPQVIRYFDKDSNLPLTLGLLVDVSQSQRSVLDQERTASSAFLDNMLKAPSGQAADHAFLIQFARETELLQDLTESKPKLQAALKELDTPSPSSGNSSSGSDSSDSGDSQGGSVRRHGGTELYDALYLSGTELMAKQTGRKAIVILSDGVDNGSRKSLASSIEAAQRANEIVYSIYFKGEQPHQDNPNRGGYPGGGGRHGGGGGFPGGGYPGGGSNPGGGGSRGGGGNENRVDGKKILERISGETGGRMFEVSKKQDLPEIYNQISEELRSQYRVGYTPDKATASDGYHQVDLTIPKQNKLQVQTRDGYYTGK